MLGATGGSEKETIVERSFQSEVLWRKHAGCEASQGFFLKHAGYKAGNKYSTSLHRRLARGIMTVGTMIIPRYIQCLTGETSKSEAY